MLLALAWALVSGSAAATAAVTLGFKGTAYDFEVISDIVDEFNRLHPEIHVTAINMAAGGSWIDRLNVWFAAGTPPDVIKMEYARSVGFVAQGLVRPLDDLIARDQEFDLSDFFPVAIAAHTFDGQVYAIPQEAQPLTMFVNKSQLEPVGVPMPGIDWTVDDLIEAAKKATRDISGDGIPDVYGWQFDTSFTRTEPFLKAFGGELLSPDGKEFILNHPNNLQALRFFHDAVYVHGVRGGTFQRGDVAFYSFGGPWSVPQYRASLPDADWDILPSPAGPGGHATTLGSDGYYIASATEYPAEAWELIKFITNEQNLTRLMQHGTIIPPRPALVEEFMRLHQLANQPPYNLEAYMKGIQIASPSRVFPNFVMAEGIFINYLNQAWDGKQSVEAVVEQMLPLLNSMLLN